MKHGYFLIALILILEFSPAAALELWNPERDDRHLKIELETVPTPPHEFERYIQELAAAAQKDASPQERQRQEDIAKNKQPKSMNPIILFRW